MRGCLVLSDHLGAVLGGERATNRTRRRVRQLTNLAGINQIVEVPCCLAAGHDHHSCHALQGKAGRSRVSHASLTGRVLAGNDSGSAMVTDWSVRTSHAPTREVMTENTALTEAKLLKPDRNQALGR